MIVKKHLKYKVGDRVFHKELGWGTVNRPNSLGLPEYEVEFDEEFDEEFSGAYRCVGMSDWEKVAYVSEDRLLMSDSFLSYLLHDIKEEVRSIKAVWKNLTLWGKFLHAIAFMLWIPVITCATLDDKYANDIGKAADKVIRIFRIYKE